MPSTDRLSNIARARVSAVVLDEASGRERAATEVFNKVDADGDENFTQDSLTGRRARSDLGGGQEKPPREPPPGHRSLRGEQLPE